MGKVIILALILVLTGSGCLFVDPLTRAQNLSQKGKFDEAIKVLEKDLISSPNSVPVKSILAQMYSNYGQALCQDQNKPPKVKYPMAKEQFAMALALNPDLKEAKEMYEMIERIQALFAAKKID